MDEETIAGRAMWSLAPYFPAADRAAVAAIDFSLYSWSCRGPGRVPLRRRDADDLCPIWHLLARRGYPPHAGAPRTDEATDLAERAGLLSTYGDVAAFYLAVQSFLRGWDDGVILDLAAALGVEMAASDHGMVGTG